MSPKLTPTCTNLCPSGSSATLPPVAAPRPLFLCRPGVCTLETRKTSTAPARTRRPTPTPFPGSIAPTSSRRSRFPPRSSKQPASARRTRCRKRHSGPFSPTGNHHTKRKWSPPTPDHHQHHHRQVSPSLWCAHPSGNPVLCQRGCDGAARVWLWVCGAVRGALQESAALPSEHHRRGRILGVPRSHSLRSLRPAVSQPGEQQQQQQQHRTPTVGSSCSGLRLQVKGASPVQNTPPPSLLILSTPPSETKCLSQNGPERKMYKIKAGK